MFPCCRFPPSVHQCRANSIYCSPSARRACEPLECVEASGRCRAGPALNLIAALCSFCSGGLTVSHLCSAWFSLACCCDVVAPGAIYWGVPQGSVVRPLLFSINQSSMMSRGTFDLDTERDFLGLQRVCNECVRHCPPQSANDDVFNVDLWRRCLRRC